MPWRFGGGDWVCGYCGCSFTGNLHGPAPKWCSPACKQAAYRARNELAGRPQPYRRTTAPRQERARIELMGDRSTTTRVTGADVATRNRRSRVTGPVDAVKPASTSSSSPGRRRGRGRGRRPSPS